MSTAGTTASIVLIRDRTLYVANVGDSSVVLGERASNGCCMAKVLTVVWFFVLCTPHIANSVCLTTCTYNRFCGTCYFQEIQHFKAVVLISGKLYRNKVTILQLLGAPTS